MGVRSKLFLTHVLVVAAAIGGADAWLLGRLRGELLERLGADLAHQAELGVEALSTMPAGGEQLLAHRLGAATHARFTLIRPDGVVAGDSELDDAAVARLENHAGRPEVREARAEGSGRALRFSTTIGAPLLYVAVRVGAADAPRGFVRAAMPATRVEAVVSEVRGAVALGSLFALLFAAALSLAVGGPLTRSTRALADAADAMAAGDLTARAHVPGADELSRLGRALGRLGDQLARELATVGEERDRLEALLGSMVEGVVVLGPDQRILLANPSARELLGMPREAPPGASLLETGRLPALFALATRALRGQRTAEELALPDGRQILVRGTPLTGTGAVLVLHDLTDVRRLEAVRRDFVANVSHELRTPLAAIRGYAETLLGGAADDPARAREFSEVIERHAERLGRLLDDLLELSRLEAGRRDLAREKVLAADAGESAMELVGPKAQARGVRIENALPEAAEFVGDRGAVEQVLVNLLDNAVKFTPAGARVLLGVEPGGDPSRLRIFVRDEGIGIDAAHLPRLFERFYRVDAGRSRETGGTGLGLAIVKHLVQAQGGEVGAESAPGKGSTFWFELPRE